MASDGLGVFFIEALRNATRVVVLTGAGASAESGVPTFRDKQTGLWEQFDVSDLATPWAYRRDPALCWGWYEWRRAAILRAQPNAGHKAIADMAELISDLTLITQNVDDLHERAGSPSVLHLHGELGKPYCGVCRRLHSVGEGIPAVPEGGERMDPPSCAWCGGQVRPGVVWFGEDLPELEWYAAREAARRCEIFFSVGTSSLVQPAASLANIAHEAGARVVQINPAPTDLGFESLTLAGAAGEVLPVLVRRAWPAVRRI